MSDKKKVLVWKTEYVGISVFLTFLTLIALFVLGLGIYLLSLFPIMIPILIVLIVICFGWYYLLCRLDVV